MTASTYGEALRRLLVYEGGYSNHPADPGGPTNFGITIADYRKYVMPGATAADVKAMPLSAAKQIYKEKYWDAQKGDQLSAGVDDSVFDYGVNSGIGRSGKVLRRIVGLPDNTSVVTSEVIAAVGKRDAAVIITAINDERLAFLQRLKTWPTFGAGWGARVHGVKAWSLSIAGGAVIPTEPGPAEGKGKIPPPKLKKVITHGGPPAIGVGGYSLWDWIIAHPQVGVLLLVAIIAAGFLAYRFITKRHLDQQETPMPNTTVVPELPTTELTERI